MGYSGAWVVKSQGRANVALQAPIDPEHLSPTDSGDLAGQPALWSNQTPVQTLPLELTPETDELGNVVGGPIDRTPDDPSFGVGSGPGLTTLEAQEIRGDLMSQDFGAVAAHRYVAAVDRDGAPHVEILDDVPGEGDSPQTLEHKRTGVGTAGDPYARVGRRIKRWYDRYIDMHRYEVELRPKYVRTATTVDQAPAVAAQSQLTSPFPAFVGRAGTADSFVAPQDRRTPGPWDESLTTDGTAAGQVSAYGLTSWGL